MLFFYFFFELEILYDLKWLLGTSVEHKCFLNDLQLEKSETANKFFSCEYLLSD